MINYPNNVLEQAIIRLEKEIRDNKTIAILVSSLGEATITLLPLLLFKISKNVGFDDNLTRNIISYYCIKFPILTIAFNTPSFCLFNENKRKQQELSYLKSNYNLLIYDYEQNKDKYSELLQSNCLEDYLLRTGYNKEDINSLFNYITVKKYVRKK